MIALYQYDGIDQALVDARVDEFIDHVERRLNGCFTRRRVLRSVTFFTMAKADQTTSVEEIPNADTLIYYMGRQDGQYIAEQLIQAGRTIDTPVVVVESMSIVKERKLFTNLQSLQEGLLNEWSNPDAPAILMIGHAFTRVKEQQNVLDDLCHSKVDDRLQDFITLAHSRRSA